MTVILMGIGTTRQVVPDSVQDPRLIGVWRVLLTIHSRKFLVFPRQCSLFGGRLCDYILGVELNSHFVFHYGRPLTEDSRISCIMCRKG
jgi:hypothetical protein